MKIETKFNLGDKVRTIRLGDRGLGTGTIIYIGIDIHLQTIYTLSFTNDKLVSCRECELVGVAEPEPDIVYYAKVHRLNYVDMNKEKLMVLPISYSSNDRNFLDNVKITYDSNGIFKAIEKIK